MAERRMFAKTIIDSDAFLDMPVSARLLYYDLAMRADDDGFVNSPKKIMKFVGASTDDMNILIARKFVIAFENGIVVIKHWRIHNYIRKDTYKETPYLEEKSQLVLDEKNAYKLKNEDGIVIACDNSLLSVDDTLTQDRIGKDSIGNIKKENIKEKKNKYGSYEHVLLTPTEYQKLKDDYLNYEELITFLDEYIEMKGYKAKNHYLCIKKWVVDAVKEKNIKRKEAKQFDRPAWLDMDL